VGVPLAHPAYQHLI